MIRFSKNSFWAHKSDHVFFSKITENIIPKSALNIPYFSDMSWSCLKCFVGNFVISEFQGRFKKYFCSINFEKIICHPSVPIIFGNPYLTQVWIHLKNGVKLAPIFRLKCPFFSNGKCATVRAGRCPWANRRPDGYGTCSRFICRCFIQFYLGSDGGEFLMMPKNIQINKPCDLQYIAQYILKSNVLRAGL